MTGWTEGNEESQDIERIVLGRGYKIVKDSLAGSTSFFSFRKKIASARARGTVEAMKAIE